MKITSGRGTAGMANSTTSFLDSAWGEEDDGDETNYPKTCLILTASVLSVMAAVALLGNMMVVKTFVSDIDLRTVGNVYIIHLAVCDCLIGVFGMVLGAVFVAMHHKWPFGETECKVYIVINFVLYTETFLAVLLIALYKHVRVRMLTLPLAEAKKQVCARVLVTWAYSLLVHSPKVIAWDDVMGPSSALGEVCRPLSTTARIPVKVVSWLLESLVPFVILVVLLVRIRQEYRKEMLVRPEGRKLVTFGQEPSERESSIQRKTGCVLIGRVFSPSNETVPTSNMSERVEVNIPIPFLAFLLVFVMCWAPYTVILFAAGFCETCLSETTLNVFYCLYLLKSCVACPCLYASCSQRAKNRLADLLAALFCCCKDAVHEIMGTTSESFLFRKVSSEIIKTFVSSKKRSTVSTTSL